MSPLRLSLQIDHIQPRTVNLDRSSAFPAAVHGDSGKSFTGEGETFFTPNELFVKPAMGTFSNMHLTFRARSRKEVAAFHKASGRDNGGSGERSYHPGNYAASLPNPDSNNVEAFYHGRTDRPAMSVELWFPGHAP